MLLDWDNFFRWAQYYQWLSVPVQKPDLCLRQGDREPGASELHLIQEQSFLKQWYFLVCVCVCECYFLFVSLQKETIVEVLTFGRLMMKLCMLAFLAASMMSLMGTSLLLSP